MLGLPTIEFTFLSLLTPDCEYTLTLKKTDNMTKLTHDEFNSLVLVARGESNDRYPIYDCAEENGDVLSNVLCSMALEERETSLRKVGEIVRRIKDKANEDYRKCASEVEALKMRIAKLQKMRDERDRCMAYGEKTRNYLPAAAYVDIAPVEIFCEEFNTLRTIPESFTYQPKKGK